MIIALLVAFSSRGPIIFRQRRYGLDGREFIVYKFRTMIVTEDGASVAQATRDDRRVTPIGGFLRRHSLDELPQLINVLQGRMSLVGPRPHAIAHNEEYRKLISGFLIRHKVLPGITGLAQINGYRGKPRGWKRCRPACSWIWSICGTGLRTGFEDSGAHGAAGRASRKSVLICFRRRDDITAARWRWFLDQECGRVRDL